MKIFHSKRVSNSRSDNRQAAPRTKSGPMDEKRPCGRKWVWLVAIVVAFALCGTVAEAQLKTPEIGSAGSRFGAVPPSEWVAGELRPLHDVDGREVFMNRLAQRKPDRLHRPADELVGLDVDALIASSTAEALALKDATRLVPIVFVAASDPVTDGLVESLARPGGNVTGVTNIAPVLAGKRLELLKETIPKLARVAVLWDSQDPNSAQHWKESQFAARELGLQLYSMQVSSVDKLEGAFKEAIKERIGALSVTPSALVTAYPKLVTDLATKHRLPAIFDRSEFVASGGLMSYGPDPAEPYRRAAAIVDKILKGAKPADIPIEQPTKFELVINLKAAKQIGLTIPPIVLMRATKVVK